jgi:hypothetical protein
MPTQSPAWEIAIRSSRSIIEKNQTAEHVVLMNRPLALAPGYWGFNRYSLPSSERGLVYVTGGPASPGRAVVDITTDPPEVVRYETFEY